MYRRPTAARSKIFHFPKSLRGIDPSNTPAYPFISKMPLIPARSFASQRLRVGESIKLINPSGSQVIDFWALAVTNDPFPTFLSMIHTRSTPHKLLPATGESLLDNRRNPILTIVEDTSPGQHDVLFAACSRERYAQLGAAEGHDNCANNLYNAVKASNDLPNKDKVLEFLGYGWMPDPFNVFMNVQVIDNNVLLNEEPTARPGDYITLKAVQDCVVVMSACPMDLSTCNGAEPTSAEFYVV